MIIMSQNRVRGHRGDIKRPVGLQRIETLLLIGGPGEGFMVEAAFDLVLEG